MAEYADREHYIPLRKSDLEELLARDPRLTPQERGPFRQFCRLAGAVFHFEYHQQLEELKDAYAPFDPDAETRPLDPASPQGRQARLGEVFDKFTALMGRANFKRLSQQDIEKAVAEVPTDWGLPTHADLNQFERLEVFARGDEVGQRSRRRWWKLWRKETIQLPLYRRLVLILKFRGGTKLEGEVDTEDVFLKVFKDVPKADLEMLLPGARVRLTKLDRGLIIYPMLSGVALMLYSIIQDVRDVETAFSRLLGGAGGALVTWSAALALGGYGYKSYYSYQVKKQDYNYKLTRSLYYQGLDNNSGVLMRLLDEAEEQECRETYLAYFCLWKHAPAEGWTPELLDDYVELYLEQHAKLKVDFEVGDALDKLERLGIVTKDGDRYRAVPLERALEALDARWDNYFKYANPDGAVTGEPGASAPGGRFFAG